MDSIKVPNLLETIPSSADVREQLADAIVRCDYLRDLLKLAERREKNQRDVRRGLEWRGKQQAE